MRACVATRTAGVPAPAFRAGAGGGVAAARARPSPRPPDPRASVRLVPRHHHLRRWAPSATPRGDSSSPDASFDEAAYDAERLALDAAAMANMERAAAAAIAAGEDDAATTALEARGAWKWAIRERIWDAMEAKDIARFPRPVHHRIPNFVGADAAAHRLATLDFFRDAACVKVNPDTPQKEVRRLVLAAGKTLMTPQPRLRTGFFSLLSKRLVPALEDDEILRQSTTSAGVAKRGVPITLDADVACDLVVVGSVAVDAVTGARVGKGEGFAELEYAILRRMGAIDDRTLVVTTVHDEQVVEGMPTEKLLVHDVPVDVIVTPTRVIRTDGSVRKPEGVYWDVLSPQKLAQVRVLRELKAKVEAETGQTLPTGPDEELPPLAVRAKRQGRGGGRGRGRGRGGGRGGDRGRGGGGGRGGGRLPAADA